RTYNSNTGVRVSRSDDTDLDGTTRVPGQSPELTAWLTKNLGHPTGEVTTVGVVLLATYTKPRARHTNHVKTHVGVNPNAVQGTVTVDVHKACR
ncbi:hypothetical protein Taro_018513, partial [Colocasia esculenta]|nr:hypothetical protein [Colocasia esculenta]